MPGGRVLCFVHRARGRKNREVPQSKRLFGGGFEIPSSEQFRRRSNGRPTRGKNREGERKGVEHQARQNRDNGFFGGRKPRRARVHKLRERRLRARGRRFKKGGAKDGDSYDARYKIADWNVVDKNTPPAFITQTQFDPYVDASIAYYLALKEAKVPAQLHMLPVGKHGYQDKKVFEMYADWLKSNGF